MKTVTVSLGNRTGSTTGRGMTFRDAIADALEANGIVKVKTVEILPGTEVDPETGGVWRRARATGKMHRRNQSRWVPWSVDALWADLTLPEEERPVEEDDDTSERGRMRKMLSPGGLVEDDDGDHVEVLDAEDIDRMAGRHDVPEWAASIVGNDVEAILVDDRTPGRFGIRLGDGTEFWVEGRLVKR